MTRAPQIPLLVAVVAAAWMSAGCNRLVFDGDGPDAGPRYVGGSACITCHEQQGQQWTGSHHDLAMQVATSETVLGDFDNASFRYADNETTFSRDGDRFMVRTDGPDGELTDYDISHTFGITPLQQYLIEFPDGRLQALGIAWDSRPAHDGGQRWFHLYPDERITHDDVLHWTRPYQNWNHMCAECHSTNLQKNYRAGDDRFETTWTDINVSCEACHGPGSEHVELARALKDGEEYSEEFLASLTVQLRASDLGVWTMNQETGTARRDSVSGFRWIDVCAPCHSRRGTISQDIVAGRPFLDTHRPALLEDGLYHADGQIQDEVYVYGSFLQSKMYAAGVTCANCHDSHGLQVLASGNALCAQCHLASKFDSPTHHFHKADGEGARCTSCHMPPKTYMGVDVRLDHSMRVPRPDLTLKVGAPNACNECHADRTPEWSAKYTEEWYGPPSGVHFAEGIAGGRARDPESFEPLVEMVADTTYAGIVRATATALLGDFPDRSVFPALEAAARDSDPIVRMASARAIASRSVAERRRILTPLLYDSIRAVRAEAVQVIATGQPSTLPAQHESAYDRALGEYRESLLLHADRPEVHVSLALVDAAAGRDTDAERALRTAIRLDPHFAAAYVNLADLLRMQGRNAEGELVLSEGLQVHPESAALRHARGLVLVRMDRHAEAMLELEKAAGLAPESPRLVYAYAIGLHSSGETAEAVAILGQAAENHPYDADILSALVTLNLETGKRGVALKYAERLAKVVPEDGAVIDVVEALKRP